MRMGVLISYLIIIAGSLNNHVIIAGFVYSWFIKLPFSLFIIQVYYIIITEKPFTSK